MFVRSLTSVRPATFQLAGVLTTYGLFFLSRPLSGQWFGAASPIHVHVIICLFVLLATALFGVWSTVSSYSAVLAGREERLTLFLEWMHRVSTRIGILVCLVVLFVSSFAPQYLPQDVVVVIVIPAILLGFSLGAGGLSRRSFFVEVIFRTAVLYLLYLADVGTAGIALFLGVSFFVHPATFFVNHRVRPVRPIRRKIEARLSSFLLFGFSLVVAPLAGSFLTHFGVIPEKALTVSLLQLCGQVLAQFPF